MTAPDLSQPQLPETEWQRLDPRMMLVHPIRELIRFLPVLIGVFVASAATPGDSWVQLVAVLVPIGVGLVRYYTTAYRIHADRVELRRGLLTTNILSTPLDRVRTVDLTASPIQRLLGLSTVRIGTGTAATLGEEGLDLDGLPIERARALRHQLLTSIAPPTATEQPATPGERLVARFDPGWLRYAPFTSAGLVVAAGVVGVGSQVLEGLGFFRDLDERDLNQLASGASVIAFPVALAAGLVLVAAFSVLGYLVTNGNYAISHTLPDGSWHVRRGLLTTRETSLDDDRLRGVSIGEPLGLRMVRGARLNAIATGLDRMQSGSSTLLPPTPRALVDRVAADVVGTTAPVHAPLSDHGPRARTRRYVRALVPSLLVAAALVGFAVAQDTRWPIGIAVLVVVAAIGLGIDRARGLGHALVDGWLVARSGSLTRRRELLGTDAIIGFNLRSTWFQRRAGLTTLVATTAGGRQAVTVLDVPEPTAIDVATRAVPGLLEQFLD